MSTTEHHPGRVWLLGDHYHGWMTFEKTPALDNDPEHQPSQLPARSSQPKFYYAPGGTWYVKKFFDRIWTEDPAQEAKVVLACAPGEIKGHVFEVPKPFALGTPTVSFTLDRFRRQPDSHSEDKVYRVKSHHGYCSALQSLKWEEAAIDLRSKLSKGEDSQLRKGCNPPATDKALEDRVNQIARWRAECEKAGVAYFDAFKKLVPDRPPPRPDVLVIEDMDMGFRDYEGFANNEAGTDGWGALLKQSFVQDPVTNHIIVLLGRSLPNWGETGLWSQLKECHSKQTIVIVNADLLRYTGAFMSRRTSWERTAQDCLEALEKQDDEKLWPFSSFAHVIVRFGVAGALHCYRNSKSDGWDADLFYDSKTHGGNFRDLEEEGGIVGNNSIFAACITRELLRSEPEVTTQEKIDTAIRAAIPACQRLFREGFGPVLIPIELGMFSSWSDPPDDLFLETPFSLDTHIGHNPTHPDLIHKITVPHKTVRDSWNIILHGIKFDLEPQIVAGPDGKKPDPGLIVARHIVQYGLGSVLNDPRAKLKLFAPIGQFGRLETIDRDEIESFRAVSNIIREYLKSVRKDPLAGPMSIAVFGPPGSGKSFTVREIVKAIDPSVEEMFFEINLAQLTSTKELASSLLRIRDAISPKKTPLVFFDEFDCRLDKDDYGWLKYFLAPMEGGTFKHPSEGMFRLERGIFVFAGGVSHRYRDFAGLKEGKPESTGSAELKESAVRLNESAAKLKEGAAALRGNVAESKEGAAKSKEGAGEANQSEPSPFMKTKGPDFISRLRGFIDIKGINVVDDPKKPDNALFMLRRAIILRSVLERNGLVSEPDKVAEIDGSLLAALLALRGDKKRKAFEYDTRSMRMVVNMCMRLHGRLEKASLPPKSLLDMHVHYDQLVDEMADRPDPKDNSADITQLT